MKKLILGLLFFVLLAYLGLAYYFSSLIIYPLRRTNAEARALMERRARIDIDTFPTSLITPKVLL
jgi:hypothetical protein